MHKQAILLVSFGVGNLKIKESCLDSIRREVQEAYPAYDVYEAWTSVFLRKKLADRGIEIKSLGSALMQLHSSGYELVIIQPTHLTAGEEFNNKIKPELEKFSGNSWEIRLGIPLLGDLSEAALIKAANCIFPVYALAVDEELVMMGHGSPHVHNPAYEKLQACADKLGLPVHIGVVEDSDTPNKTMVLARLRQRGAKRVFLCPLLLCGGNHATEDMAGDSQESWKTVLEAAGIQVRCNTDGLGERREFRKLYVDAISKWI